VDIQLKLDRLVLIMQGVLHMCLKDDIKGSISANSTVWKLLDKWHVFQACFWKL